jgi:phosphohistidine phosphatase SixA
MKLITLLLSFSLLITACSRTYYVVRHAEKAVQEPNMTSDVPLSAAGEQRALVLRDSLKDKKIGYIFSTNRVRTKSTAAPLAAALQLPTTVYEQADSNFIRMLMKLKKNTLIVGHSNTVDDIVNGLCLGNNIITELKDNQYDKLYKVRLTRKWWGKYYNLREIRYGQYSQ